MFERDLGDGWKMVVPDDNTSIDLIDRDDFMRGYIEFGHFELHDDCISVPAEVLLKFLNAAFEWEKSNA